jgi:2-amino-4-hydroxy-6-hydroxymethyldihydropteridine diphosphokinase
MALVYLGLGTNLGDKVGNLNQAILKLSMEVGFVIRQSLFYKSKSWGFESDNEFVNAVLLLETTLSPFNLLAKTQEIERNLGRARKTTDGYEDRLIDIDILMYDNLIIDQPTLKVPHPLITQRNFVLNPLLEIAPELIDPVSGKKFRDLVQF